MLNFIVDFHLLIDMEQNCEVKACSCTATLLRRKDIGRTIFDQYLSCGIARRPSAESGAVLRNILSMI